MTKKFSHEDYIVGWICPLEVEQIAALEMLDEEHERLPQPATDHHVYNLGSIAGHNVVIAGLHTPGNNPAATVVTQMRSTFPNLRFGFLVGIGGGVPVKTDNGVIRLGDVVVNLAAKRARSRIDSLEQNINRVDTNIRGLRHYKYPGATHDYLYKPDYTHLEPDLLCDECACDASQRVSRTLEGADDKPYVVVHRGTIATGELVIKDAMLRDRLAREHNLLRFEMEATGALVDLPCMVIRGISDYCDSHKNDRWHGYASLAAAAYARQLFFHMPLTEVRSYVSEAAQNDIHHVRLRQQDKDCEEILDWLTPIDYGPQQSDFFRRRQPGTGQWLLNSTEYQNWLKASNQTLFCPGIPRAGKSILNSIVVKDLARRFSKDETAAVVYIYCYRYRLNSKALYDQHRDERTRPSRDEILRTLHLITAMYPKVFIALDALDECQGSNACRSSFLSEIFDLQNKTGLSLFATSRPIPDIEKEFKGCLCREIIAIYADVCNYLDGHLSELPDFVLRSPMLQREIKAEISKAVEGMFLLAQLYVSSLEDKITPRAVKDALRQSGSETQPIEDPTNLITLRRNLHYLFNTRRFTFIPKQDTASLGGSLALYVFSPDDNPDLIPLYYNQSPAPLSGISIEHIFTRFAWTIFSDKTLRFFKGAAEYAVLLFDPQAGKMIETKLRSPEVQMSLNIFGSSSCTLSPKKRLQDQSVEDH
ncbi:nucleoside phosphorylase domain-containing protein [Ilyonectria destructans]|nr:nucleoside phosphorylase domain-containing protein [Ilyonectria destructans]